MLKKLITDKNYYKICKTISNNDVSDNQLKKYDYIIENKLINLLCYYSSHVVTLLMII